MEATKVAGEPSDWKAAVYFLPSQQLDLSLLRFRGSAAACKPRVARSRLVATKYSSSNSLLVVWSIEQDHHREDTSCLLMLNDRDYRN